MKNRCLAKVSRDIVYYDLTADISAQREQGFNEIDSIFSAHNVIPGIQRLVNKYLWNRECLKITLQGELGDLGCRKSTQGMMDRGRDWLDENKISSPISLNGETGFCWELC